MSRVGHGSGPFSARSSVAHLRQDPNKTEKLAELFDAEVRRVLDLHAPL